MTSSGSQYLASVQSSGNTKHFWQYENLFTSLQYETVFQVSARFLAAGASALDWGCGNGHFSHFLKSQGANVTAFTIQPASSYLDRETSIRYVQGSMNEPVRLPFEDNTFDSVFSIGVLEHVYETGGDEVASLREIRRVLKPGGRFLCFHFPNKHQWVEPVGKMLGVNEHFHERKYTIADINRFTEESALRLVDYGRYNFMPRNQFRKLPKVLQRGNVIPRALHWFDRGLAATLPFFCTNQYFVAQKCD